jgi:hypothetical protein
VLGLHDIFGNLSVLKLAVYAPISYILPSRLRKYEEIYDTQVEGGRGKLRQADRERSLQALMTTNLLKRLESSNPTALPARPKTKSGGSDSAICSGTRCNRCKRLSRTLRSSSLFGIGVFSSPVNANKFSRAAAPNRHVCEIASNRDPTIGRS